jgi:hypothetical protein
MPTPNDSAIPLVEGLDASWNPVLSSIPEDKRAEAASVIKERNSQYTQLEKDFEPWSDFNKSGITPDTAQFALDLYYAMEHQPEQVYAALGKHLGVSAREVKTAMEESTESTEQPAGSAGDVDFTQHPTFQQMKQQMDAMAQILIANRDAETQTQQQREQDAALEKEMSALKSKVGEFDEREILMRMAQLDMNAEEAYEDYSSFVNKVRGKQPAPFVIGGGGAAPRPALDVKKMNDKQTKDLVTQMIEHSITQG